MRHVILISGARGEGKTTLCIRLFEKLVSDGFRPFAIVEKNERDTAGIPVRLWLEELATGESKLLAERASARQGAGGQPYPPFEFSRDVFAWAVSRLCAALDEGRSPIIVDEAGPLETREGGGFMPFLARAARESRPSLIVTVRPDCAARLSELLNSEPGGPDQPRVITLPARKDGFETSDRLVSELIRHCQPQS